ncbi:MAG TPA: bifunctional alpha,alpha-trehalose-phosphate synthase (UDP-forming)/trehalose-phosphatase [Bryobacteraceae bacterium]|jgi:trehalose 6-phosphate synthase/phosphatase|nr:bifunctional alpha,alpha-trehalose-phosphate synthase (UDP-forming)/trehalose-phosphatase [Bryobacteraceae bacterium]
MAASDTQTIPGEQAEAPPTGSKLIVVSNRLPVTLVRDGDTWTAKASSGGLATAMEPVLKRTGGIWIGWPGDDGTIDPANRQAILSDLSQGYSYIPAELEPGNAKPFYEGYPNQTLWPLFHYFPSRMNFTADGWAAYQNGNRVFCDAVGKEVEGNDLIWIHDYHLMLLPECIREHARGAKIGFFLHIPFPSSEVFAMLPHREEVLKGLLGADLIAFHTHHYLQHFRGSLLRVLGLESRIDSLDYNGRTIRLDVLPIGIDPRELPDLVESDPETATHLHELQQRYSDQHILVAVDRLDYTKGIPQRMRTYRRLLANHPELTGKVVLIQVAVPSRQGIEEYQGLQSELNELVGEINGALATPHWTPIVYLRQGVSRTELAALYALADVAWVTPLRDGLNLVAKEYCACKPDGNGVLVLSEFAGAAAEMGEALLVNPYNEDEVADAVMRALQMDRTERQARLLPMRARVLRNNVFVWADRFLDKLADASAPRESTPLVDFSALRTSYRNASRRILIFDYDGTLVPITDDPNSSKPSVDLIRNLTRLASDPCNTVAVISGRRSADMERWLGDIANLYIGAEHGMLVHQPSEEGWHALNGLNPDLQWKERIRPILQQFADRAPGSFVEEKQFSLVWHYRRVEAEFGAWLAKELLALLENMLSDTNARPVHGKKIVEVKSTLANKGEFAAWLVDRRGPAEFILAAGDDETDEDMFARLNGAAVTLHVGYGRSIAAFRLRQRSSMDRLLSEALQ